MNQTIRAHGRSRQVLRALHRHGPMTWRALQQIIDPPMKPGRLGSTLGLLKAKGWIVDRGKISPCLQINQRGHFWDEISAEIGVSQESLKQSWARFFVIEFEDQAAVWAERLSGLIPNVEALRNYEIAADPTLRSMLFRDVNGQQIGPDLLLRLPGAAGTDAIQVVVRLDRPHHCHRRVMDTFRKDAADPNIDGALYLVPPEDREYRSGLIAGSRYLRSTLKTRASGEFFLMFGNSSDTHRGIDPPLQSSERKPLSIITWMQLLQQVKAGL